MLTPLTHWRNSTVCRLPTLNRLRSLSSCGYWKTGYPLSSGKQRKTPSVSTPRRTCRRSKSIFAESEFTRPTIEDHWLVSSERPPTADAKPSVLNFCTLYHQG